MKMGVPPLTFESVCSGDVQIAGTVVLVGKISEM